MFEFGAGIVACRVFALRIDQAPEAGYVDWCIIHMLQNGHYVDSKEQLVQQGFEVYVH